MTGVKTCAWCSVSCDGSCPYVLGAVRGHLCGACARDLGELVTQWAAKRQRAERAERLKEAEERRKAHELELEQLPGAMRRALRKRGEAA